MKIDKVNERKIEQDVEQLLNGKLTRRQFLMRMGLLGLSLTFSNQLLTACGVPPAEAPTAAPTAVTGPTSAPAATAVPSKGVLNYWAGPVAVPGDTWGLTEQLTGYKVNMVDNGTALGPVLAQLQAGTADQFDIIGLNRGAQMKLAPAGFIVPVDPNRFAMSKQAYDFWPTNNPMYQYEGKLYGIPVFGNGDSMAYLPERMGGEVTSYSVLFDPQFKGHTAMENRYSAAMIKTAMYLKNGQGADIKDPGEMNPTELKLVADFLIEKKKAGQFRTFWSGLNDAINLLGNEEVWVMDAWEPVVYALKSRGKNVEYAWPKEGFSLWAMANYLPKKAVDRGMEQAYYDFLDFQFGGWYTAQQMKVHGYLVPTPLGVTYAEQHPDEYDVKALQGLKDRTRRKFTEFPGYWENYSPVYTQDYEEQWQRVLSA